MVVLDTTIMLIALPSAQHALGLSVTGRQWVITAYTIAFGGLLPAGPGALGAAAAFAGTLGIPAHPAGPWPGRDEVAVSLIRPDGYVGSASDYPSGDDVTTALTTAAIASETESPR